MEKYISLTENQLNSIQHDPKNPMPANGYIQFWLNGEVVATTDLIEGSSSNQRFKTAEIVGVKEFDDCWFLTKDGDIRFKASSMLGIDASEIDSDFGKSQGIKYQEFLKRNDGDRCKNCGHKLND